MLLSMLCAARVAQPSAVVSSFSRKSLPLGILHLALVIWPWRCNTSPEPHCVKVVTHCVKVLTDCVSDVSSPAPVTSDDSPVSHRVRPKLRFTCSPRKSKKTRHFHWAPAKATGPDIHTAPRRTPADTRHRASTAHVDVAAQHAARVVVASVDATVMTDVSWWRPSTLIVRLAARVCVRTHTGRRGESARKRTCSAHSSSHFRSHRETAMLISLHVPP